MDVSSITQIVANLGFPIAACVALFWKINKQDETHKEELAAMREALENNTLVCMKLYERLGGDDGEK